MSSALFSASSECLFFAPQNTAGPAMRTVNRSMDELDALGFAGIPRRQPSPLSSSSSSSSSTDSSPIPRMHYLPPPTPPLSDDDEPILAPPPYARYISSDSRYQFAGASWEFADPISEDVITVSNGDVIKAKLRYKLYKLRAGKLAEPWDVFLNRSLKPGEAPWAPEGSPLWKLSKSEMVVRAATLPAPPRPTFSTSSLAVPPGLTRSRSFGDLTGRN